MRFSSKIDGWLIPIMLLAFAGLVAALIGVLVEPTPWPVRVLTAIMVVLLPALSLDRLKVSYGKHKYVLVSPTVLSRCSNCRQSMNDAKDHFGWDKDIESLLELVAENIDGEHAGA